jgi:hypothetical protein
VSAHAYMKLCLYSFMNEMPKKRDRKRLRKIERSIEKGKEKETARIEKNIMKSPMIEKSAKEGMKFCNCMARLENDICRRFRIFSTPMGFTCA